MIRACALSDLDDKKPLAVEVGDVAVVLVREGDEVHALRDECSHASLSLSEGEVTRKGIECWLHGSCFDLRTGQPSSPPATEPVDVYAVRIDGDDVYVDPTTTLN
ncbi:3-phenylpropionate/trans-cinnamate dioxygenase ferredoxin subunit [Kibdelosporangium banguiense]|uniref:3-phenylpropionate/trans-cinnamate dioxygenase ferredoxin subunit n=1 Tax=Kibdelosporangium banguiense TaxID=1365924 RepID=A0ABS4U1H3_9PSEU|nr:non-heme iron oxygenase ferredoxin subunit [Kibdelosporangium banguiense]MBP2330041.1 3-phenylpropionate/trans-cinnamate dioxygenase ferredoxin subunit [Kibdelosporangium banguiense]